MSDNVSHLFPDRAVPACDVEIEHTSNYCAHQQITLVTHDRSVVCRKCGATLDPFEYLVKEAAAIKSAWNQHRMVLHKTAELRKACDQLEKERRRLYGQVKRLKEKSGPVVDLRNG